MSLSPITVCSVGLFSPLVASKDLQQKLTPSLGLIRQCLWYRTPGEALDSVCVHCSSVTFQKLSWSSMRYMYRLTDTSIELQRRTLGGYPNRLHTGEEGMVTTHPCAITDTYQSGQPNVSGLRLISTLDHRSREDRISCRCILMFPDFKAAWCTCLSSLPKERLAMGKGKSRNAASS